MDLEELKTQWNRLSVRVDHLEQENRRLASELATGRAISAQQRLAKRYTLHAVCGLILPFLAPSLVYVLHMPVWVAIVYAAFGVICFLIDLMLARYVRRNNLATQTVVASLVSMLKIKRNQRRLQLTLIAICFSFLAFAFFPYIMDEPHILIGAGVGLVLGLVFGLKEYQKKVRLINEILDELKAAIGTAGK